MEVELKRNSGRSFEKMTITITDSREWVFLQAAVNQQVKRERKFSEGLGQIFGEDESEKIILSVQRALRGDLNEKQF